MNDEFDKMNAEMKYLRDKLSTTFGVGDRLELQVMLRNLSETFEQDYHYPEDSLCNECVNRDICMEHELHRDRIVQYCKYWLN